jgi:hypothetical protein
MTGECWWLVRLEGGPFDGDVADVEWSVVPRRLWVIFCQRCQDTHWFEMSLDGGECYRLVEHDDVALTAKYVQGDLGVGDGHLTARRKTPTLV